MDITDAQHILICLRYGIGDLVMELPVLDTLRRVAPKARISALGAHPAVDLLDNDPRIDHVFSVQMWGFTHWGDAGDSDTTKQVKAWLCSRNFDLVLDASHAVVGVRDAIRASGLPIRDTFEWMHNQGLAMGLDGLAAIQHAVHIGWGLRVSPTVRQRIHLTAADQAFAQRLVDTNFPGEGPLCALSPVASSPLKRWPLPRLASLADELAAQLDARFLLFSGPQTWTVDEFLQSRRVQAPLLVIGELPLKRVAALLGQCDLYVGNDTGLMHLAAAMDVPVAAVFGPTSPRIYLPRRGRALHSVRECPHRREHAMGPPACLIHGHCTQNVRSCVDDVDLAAVLDAVTYSMARRPARIPRRDQQRVTGNPHMENPTGT